MNDQLGNFLPCDVLDDYLAGEQAGDRRTEFESHLETCHSCRAAVDEWQLLCRTLQSATRELETPSPDLLERIESTAALRQPRDARDPRNWRVAGLVAASLVAAALFASILQPRPPHLELAKSPQTQRKLAKLTGTKAPLPPKVEFSDDVIAVPIDIGDPNVTVVWVYPTAPAASHTN